MPSKNLDQAPQRTFRARPACAAATVFSAALLLATTGAAAEDDATRAFLRCMALQNDTERLACYDRLAHEVVELGLPGSRAPGAGAGSAAAAAGSSSQPASAQPAPEEQFGMAQASPGEEISSITASVVGGFAGWAGGTVFELDNGQVWEQVGSDRYEYAGRDRKVVIKRALFGSFQLSPEGLNRRVRVRRVE
jgi:hypothetical protein